MRKKSIVAGAVSLAMAVASPAFAAHGVAKNSETGRAGVGDTASVAGVMKEKQLGEVVVTTQKRNQSSVEVPAAVSAMTGAMLGSLNLNQMDQVSAFIPGIQIQQQSPNNSSYAVRGVTSDDGSATSQPRVSVFLDGVANFRTQASQVELFDMDRVEVVKGPQGTLFGRGAEIGAIDLIRKKPTAALSGELSLNVGTRGQLGAGGFLNTPIGNRVSNRFAFSFDRHNGYIDNKAGGRLNGKSSIALRNSTRFLLGEQTRMDLVIDFQHDSYPGTSFKSNNAYFYDNTDPNAAANLEEGDWLGINRNIGGAMLNINSRLNAAWTLTSITGFRGYKSKENFDADGTYLPLLKCAEDAKGLQVSQELRFNYDNRGPLKAFAGISYFYEHAEQKATIHSNLQYFYPIILASQVNPTLKTSIDGLITAIGAMDFSAFGAVGTMMQQSLVEQLQAKESEWFASSSYATATPDFYGDIDNIVKGLTSQGMGMELGLEQVLSMFGISSDSQMGQQLSTLKQMSAQELTTDHQENATNYGENHAVDVFADASYNIAKGLTATLGLRGTYEHQRSGYSSTSAISDTPFGIGAVLYQPSEGGRTVWASKDYLSVVGRFALNYMWQRNNVYATVSRGRRPGVISFSNNPDKRVSLKPEIIWNYEVGVKGYIDSKFYYDICAYYYDWYHFQSSTLESNGTSKIYVATDGGRAHSLGIEATLRYAVCRGLDVFASYAYNDGKFNSTDEDGNAQEYAGNRFRLTPKHTFSAGLNLTVPVNKVSMIYFNPTYTWKSKVYFEDDNDEELTQDGFGLLNFTLGYHYSPRKVSYDVSLFGRNVLDEKYIVDAGNSGRQIGFPTFVGGSRSVFGVMLKVGF